MKPTRSLDQASSLDETSVRQHRRVERPFPSGQFMIVTSYHLADVPIFRLNSIFSVGIDGLFEYAGSAASKGPRELDLILVRNLWP